MMMTIIIFIRNLIVINYNNDKDHNNYNNSYCRYIRSLAAWPVPGVQSVERGRKIHEEKKTTSLYYLNAWNWVFVHTQYYTQSADFTQHSELSLSIPE